jgi:hypothetical protein
VTLVDGPVREENSRRSNSVRKESPCALSSWRGEECGKYTVLYTQDVPQRRRSSIMESKGDH